MSSLEFVAFDIETTGFEAAAGDEVTVAGFALPLGCRVFCQTAGRDTAGVEAAVQDRVPAAVTVHVTETRSERALFAAVEEFAAARLQGRDRALVAFNGDVWSGGFDLPFLRSRCAALDVAWPFPELAYADLLPVMRKRFNSVVDGDSVGDLVGVYDALIGGDAGAVDPFADSGEAVAAFERGDIAAVCLHNIADIRRTAALAEVAETYCSKSDIPLKSLTPTMHDT